MLKKGYSRKNMLLHIVKVVFDISSCDSQVQSSRAESGCSKKTYDATLQIKNLKRKLIEIEHEIDRSERIFT